MKNLTLFVIICLISAGVGCSSASAPGGNSNAAVNANAPANVPPEFSAKPITPNGESTPGIPPANVANLSNLPKGTTPTPGIPSNTELNKPFKPGATPTPGIPDPETLKKQINRSIDANVVNQLPKSQKELEKTVNDGLKSVRKNQ